MNRHNKITLVATVAFLLFIIVYAAYAYISPITSLNNLNIDTQISGPLFFSATGGDNLNMYVDVSAMDPSNSGNVVASGSDNITITLETDGLEGICCNYDIAWEWDETDNAKDQYQISKGGVNEFVLSGTLNETMQNASGTMQNVHQNLSAFASQLPNYNSKKLSNSVYSSSICNNANGLTTKAQQVYSLNLNFYNLNVAQDQFRGSQLNGKVKIDNVSCSLNKTLSDTVLALESENDYVSSDGSIYRVVDQNGVRYEGENPDNYVYYNCTDESDASTCELWRIIGTFNGSDMNLDSNKEYTKIIKATSIGTMKWDEEYENDWVNSTLNTYLNGEYLNSLSSVAQGQIARYNNNYSTWHLRGPQYDTSYLLSVSEWYNAERNTGTPGYRNGVEGGADAAKEAAIGLMYPSDYGYAVYGENCSSESFDTMNNHYKSCSAYSWILSNMEWTITPGGGGDGLAYVIDSSFFPGTDAAFFEHFVRPTLYLDSDVVVTSGDGSESRPYKLSKKFKTLSDTVLALEGDTDYTSSQDGTIYRVVDQNGVRYEGKNPDNYVEYNGELWRIIGTFNGSDMNLDPSKKYTKIARSTQLETYMEWDYNPSETIQYENDWVNSTLNAYLNGEYLSSLSTTAQEMIAEHNGKYSLWHLRGTDITTDQSLYAAGWYEIERSTGTPGYRNGVLGAADAAKEAAIGLMYPSDYGYAAYGSSCNNENTETLSNYEGSCGAVDWLLYLDNLYSFEWLISPSADSSGGVFGVAGEGGGYVSIDSVSEAYPARPVLYLSSEVEIVGGNWSEENPYKLHYEAPKEYLSDYVLALESEDDYTSKADGSIYRVVDQNGIRYEGKNPDNYVEYNGELWRIIGTFNGSDMNLDPNKEYTKIIKATPLDTYMAWDSTLPCENDWVNSTLNQYLNGEYLGSLSTTAQDQIAKYNDKYSLWHLRGTDSATHETLYAAGWYDIERNTGTPGYRNGVLGDADASKEAAIGLMYPSDYGYAAYGSSCNNESTETLFNYKGSCAAVDWLLYSDYWESLISPYAGNSGYAFWVYGNVGGYVYGSTVNGVIAARPALYLEADVEIEPQDGTAENPHKLK